MLLCLFTTLPANSQTKSILFDRLTVENGLRNPSVLQLMQDDKGFIWMVTPTGIVRYDGYQTKTYIPFLNKDNPYYPRLFAKLFKDSKGIIWLGIADQHRANLFRYDPVTDSLVPFLYDPSAEKNPIPAGITALGEDKFGHLLLGVYHHGLYVVDKSDLNNGIVIAHYLPKKSTENGFPSSHIEHPILMDEKGNNWIPTHDGICKYDPIKEKFSSFQIPDAQTAESRITKTLHLADTKVLWVGTGNNGLWKFDLQNESFVQQFLHDPSDNTSLPGNRVYNIESTINGQLWVSVSPLDDIHSKLAIFEPSKSAFTLVQDRANLDTKHPYTVIMDLMADQSGNMWMCSWQRGVFRYSLTKDAFQLKEWPRRIRNRTEESYITSFFEAAEEPFGIGTEEGLWKWNQTTTALQQFVVKPLEATKSNHVGSTIIGLSEKRLLFSLGNQLHTFTIDAQQFASHSERLEIEPKLFKQSNDRIWGFNIDGICQILDTEKLQLSCISNQESKNLGFVTAFAEKSANELWIGTNQEGLYHFDPNTNSLTRYLEEYGIHDIEFDQAGQCWVITHSSGLRIFDQDANQLVALTPEEDERIGQPEEMVKSYDGLFWITSSRGIIEFDPKTRRTLRRFTPSNWQLPSQTWHENANQSPFISKAGKLFFSSANGILYFHPDSIRIDSIPPQIALTDFYLSNERLIPGIDSLLTIDISYADTIVLGYQQNDFTIHFAALHYKAPAENLYRFRLDNFNPSGEWSPATTQRFAPYPNMRPGHYRFRVQAANSDGVWTQDESQEAQLTIIIRPAWYNNAWAYAVYLLLLILGIIFGYRLLIRRQLQRAETERLRELEAVKSGLYTNITHEFRTPLTLILGQVQQIREGWEVVPRNLLDSISRNGNQLLRLVNQLLGIATIETGNLELQPVRSDIVSFFERNVAAFSAMAKHQELHLTFKSDPQELLLDFDPSYLKQIIDNLLSNAIKFTPPGGHIICTLAKTENQVIFEVEDTGIGIDSEDLPYIFDRFYRSKKQQPNSRIKAGEGAGIGLAFSRELVGLMKGEIRVQSTPGQGTRFSIYLPITHSAPFQKELVNEKLSTFEFNLNNNDRQAHSSSDHQTSPEAPIVLIVEDHADVRSYLRACLESNYQVLEAVDGQVGHQLAQEVVPDLVISDVMMPKMDGYELCHSLKSNQSTSHIPIVLLTAKADAQSRLTGLQKGADAYLAKPFLKQELLIRVEKLLELRAKLQFFYQSLSAESLIEALPVPEPEEAEFVNQVKNLVLQQLDQGQFGVQKLAEDLFLSRSQLNRKMQALMGIPAVELIRDLRLTKAIELLRKEELTISEIAYKTGFTDPRYFSRVFKQVHGLTPSQFRQGHSPS